MTFSISCSKENLGHYTRRISAFSFHMEVINDHLRSILFVPDPVTGTVSLTAENSNSAARMISAPGEFTINDTDALMVQSSRFQTALSTIPDGPVSLRSENDGKTLVIEAGEGRPSVSIPARVIDITDSSVQVPSVGEPYGDGITVWINDMVRANSNASQAIGVTNANNRAFGDVLLQSHPRTDGKTTLKLGAQRTSGSLVWNSIQANGDLDITTLLPSSSASDMIAFTTILSRLASDPNSPVLRIQYDDDKGAENRRCLHLKSYSRSDAADDDNSKSAKKDGTAKKVELPTAAELDGGEWTETMHVRMAVSSADPMKHGLSSDKNMDRIRAFIGKLSDETSLVVSHQEFMQNMRAAATMAGMNTGQNQHQGLVALKYNGETLSFEVDGDASYQNEIPLLSEGTNVGQFWLPWILVRNMYGTYPIDTDTDNPTIRLNVLMMEDPKAGGIRPSAVILMTEDDWENRAENPLPEDYLALITVIHSI